jgi:molybdopterin/thiamine biosynthesis adenylyltransferase
LRADGYDVSVKMPAHLLIRDVPYVTPDKKVKRGILVSELGNVAGETVAAPANHVVYFVGERPCDADGTTLPGVTPLNPPNTALGEGLTLSYQISRAPKTKPFPDFHAKMTALINIVSGPAMEREPGVTARTNPVVVPDEGESVFKYLDTAATKAGIISANKKLETGKVGILGVGGTGSYVLDLVAKTPVPEIHIFDGDVFYNHNAFRSPGAPSIEDLQTKPKKVAYLAGLYGKMRNCIFPHDCYIDETNVELLKDLDFVFICIDKGKAKRVIVEKLEEWGKSFIDVGMGVQLVEEALLGIITITTSTPQKRDHFRERVVFNDGQAENEYSRNVQIPDLNALNATLAVIKWKKLRGYYHDFSKEHFCSYMIEGNRLANEDNA